MVNIGPERGGAGGEGAAFRIGDALQRNPENVSRQRVAVVTGANRDIGGEITFALAKKLNYAVIGTHRDPGKETKGKSAARGAEIRSEVVSRGGEWLLGDITTPEGRQSLIDGVDRKGGKLDLLVLNAANASRELNVDANCNLIDSFLPKMNQGGLIVFMQSVPGQFADILDIENRWVGYAPVARSKNEAEKEIRKKEEAASEHGVKILYLVPPEVSNTRNMSVFNALSKGEASQIHGQISRDLGLPEAVETGEVADKLVELIETKDSLNQGHMEFFNGTIDARPALRSVYDGDQALYIDTMEANGQAHMIVAESRIAEANIDMVGNVEGNLDNATSTAVIREEHIEGHFGVMPGHKGLRIVEETLRGVFEPENEGYTIMLTDAAEVRFGAMVVPGNEIHTEVNRTGSTSLGDVYSAKVMAGEEVCYEMTGLMFRKVTKEEGEQMRSHQLAEVAAQSALLAAGGFQTVAAGSDLLPIYKGIERFSVIRNPKKGEAIRIVPELSPSAADNGTSASVNIYSGEDLIAWADKVEGAMLKASTVRGLKRRAERRNSKSEEEIK